MRVLVFPTDTGQGHNTASLAVKEALDLRGADVRVLDILNTGRQKSSFVSKLYDSMVNRVPAFFGALYLLGEHISSSERHSPIYWLNTLYGKALYILIEEQQPNVIVCPHMFSAHAVTYLIERYGLTIPTVGIITDYTCSPFWEETRLSRYIVANTEIADECAAKGMDRERLVPLGIPVCSKFRSKIPKQEARAAFGIEKDKVLVIMGGSMGYGKIPALVNEVCLRIPDAQVVAVCGNNRPIRDRVQAIPGVMALGYINNIDVLMDAADVLLTKPGGLSTTEAMVKRVPLVITMPIPGGEVRNSAFISGMGMAFTADTVKDAAEAAYSLLVDPKARARMVAAQEMYCNRNAASEIGDLIVHIGGDRTC